MEYKILIIKNRYKKKVDFSDGIKHIEKNTPLKLVFDEIETDIDLVFGEVGNGTFKGGVPTNYQDFKKFVPENKYNAVCLLYGNDCPFIRVSITYYSTLYQNTEFMAVVNDRDRGATLSHDLFHAFFKALSRKGIYLQDPMDTYLRDNELGIDKGITNRTLALELLKPYWERIVKPNSIIQNIVATVTPKKKYKYFSDSEIVGLKHELVTILDNIRHEAGFPMVITSGLRTKKENDALKDSASNSGHLRGWEADIKCTDSKKRDKLIELSYKYGITRRGIGKGFVHLGIDPTLPQNVMWHYYK